MIGDVEVREAGTKGQGVFALRDFAPGQFIFRRRNGRVVTTDQIPSLSPEEQIHLTELDWDRFAIVLAPGAFLNHSCDPNALRSGVKVFAWRAIRAGDEITIDYRLNAFGDDRWDCHCGSANCPGFVHGGFLDMDEERQKLLLPYAPPFIVREYRRRRRERG